MNQGSSIGTTRYFAEISRETLFDGVYAGRARVGYTERLEEIGRNAAAALAQLYDDLLRNKTTIKFIEQRQLRKIEGLAETLDETAKYARGGARKSAGDIRRLLQTFSLPARYSLNQIQRQAEELRRTGGTARAASDKLLLEITATYLTYDKSRSNKGKNNKALGTADYDDAVAREVLGDRFTRSSAYRRGEAYGTMIRAQAEKLVKTIRTDVKNAVRGNAPIGDVEAKRLLSVVSALGAHCSGGVTAGFAQELKQLQVLDAGRVGGYNGSSGSTGAPGRLTLEEAIRQYNADAGTSIAHTVDGDGDVTIDFGNGVVRAYPKGTFFTENGVVTLDSKLWLIEAYVNASSEAGKSQNGQKEDLSELEMKFLATVIGEGLSTNETEWKAIAHVIMNRVGNYEWARYTLDNVLNPSHFEAVGGKIFESVMTYFEWGRPSTYQDRFNTITPAAEKYEMIIAAVMPVYRGEEDDFTGGAVYFSRGVPPFVNAEKDEVILYGTEHHRFFLYPYR